MNRSSFEVLAAIDLRGGRVVRLRQGDFGRETAYRVDPVATAATFAEAGVPWLHVVDLDAAHTGKASSAGAVRAIIDGVGDRVAIEVAGGLRSEAAVDEVLRAGASRVVLGTAALREPAFAGRLVDRHGADRIAIALDVRQGQAVGEGWRSAAGGVPVAEALLRLADEGVATFEVTSIERDGLLEGPDLDLLGTVVALGRGSVIASGGIASLDDLLAVRDGGCGGAIVGRAIYEGRIDLSEALGVFRAR